MSIRNLPLAVLRSLRIGAWMVAALLTIVGCGSGGGGESTYPLEGDVQPDRDVEVAPGSYAIDSLTLPPGVTMTSDGPLTLEIAGDLDLDGRLDVDGKVVLRVGGTTEIDGEVVSDGGGVAPAALGTASDTPMTDLSDGVYLVAAGDLTLGASATFEVAGPLVLTDDAAQLDRTPAEVNDEAETADGEDPTLVPLPPDDPLFDAQALSAGASALGPAQNPRWILRGRADLRGWPGNRPVVLFWFQGSADLQLDGVEILGPKGVTPPADDATGDPGSDADGDDGSDGMNLNIRNTGGAITVTGTTTFALTDGGDGGDAQALCGKATGGDGGNAGNFRMTASGGIDIQGTLRIEPGDGGTGGAATATGQAGCDVEAEGGEGADVRKRLYVRGSVSPIENIEIGDQTGGAGGTATATGGDGVDGEQCMDGQDGGDATATGGEGGESTIAVGGLGVTLDGEATAGAGGQATATGGEGGRGGDCPGGDGGEGGVGGQATATGGDAGDETEAAAGGEATSNGGAGGDGGDTCGPPDGSGGDGGVGGAAEATGGRGSDDARAPTSGSAGDGGNGGDGASPGSGAAGGEGTGTPDDLADGADGEDGPECDSPPPPPPSGDVELEIDFSAISQGEIPDGASFCLPVDPVGETSVDTSQVRVLVEFDYGASALRRSASLETQSIRSLNHIEILGAMSFLVVLGACNDPVLALRASSMVMQVVFVNSFNQLLLQYLLADDFATVASQDGAGELSGAAEEPSSSWRVVNESSSTGAVATEGAIVTIPEDEFPE